MPLRTIWDDPWDLMGRSTSDGMGWFRGAQKDGVCW